MDTEQLIKNREMEQRMFNELLKDRRHQRRITYIKYGIIAVLGLGYLGTFIAGTLQMRHEEPKPGNYAALVRIEGEIGAGKSASAETVNPLLEKAFADQSAKGVILKINSPGGSPVQSALINEKILELKSKYPNKKVVAVGEDMLTSGAYFIAVAADEIVVNRSTITGSIGVITRGFGFRGLIDKLGVERRVMTAGESKNMMDPFSPQTETEKQTQAQLLQAIHVHFIEAVKEGRGSRLSVEAPDIFSGKVWTGEQAIPLGIVDELGSVQSAARVHLGTEIIQEYAPRKGLMDMLVSGIGIKVGELVAPALVDSPQLLPN